MWNRRGCCKRRGGPSIGGIMVAVGLGIFIANIIPYYLLIALLGFALIVVGIWFLCRH